MSKRTRQDVAAERKTGAGSAAKKRAADKSVGEKDAHKRSDAASSKTPQVMRLVEMPGEVNPVIIAGKSAIPRQLRGVPLSRVMRKEADELLGSTDEVIDLTAQLADENAAAILRRFNACCCEKCVAELSRITREKLPSRFVRAGSREYDDIKEPLRKTVVTQMIRELLGNKRRNFHTVT